MRTRIKICGFTDPDDLRAALDLGIDAIGLNLAKGPRKISLTQAEDLRKLIPPGVSAVGLFVNAPLDEVIAAAQSLHLDWVQCHGDESPAYITELSQHLPVIQAIRVQDRSSLPLATQRHPQALLLDAYVPGIEGGSGHSWNHQLLADWQAPTPWLVAGGITPATVTDMLRQLAHIQQYPWGIDCASGVESSPGRKDPAAMQALVAAVAENDRLRSTN